MMKVQHETRKAMVTSSCGCYEVIWAPEQIPFVTVVELEFKNSNQEAKNIRHASIRYFLVVLAKFDLIYLIMSCSTGTLVNIRSRID